jgi:type I restriction enzyme S subunit
MKTMENRKRGSVGEHQGVAMKKGWPMKTLGEVCEVFADGDWVESKDQSSEGIRLIQTGNVGEGVFKDRAEKARYISEATFKRLRCTEIVEGDCLVSRLPDPVGRSCILPDTGERMITAVDCTILRFNPKQLLPTFFNLYSQSDDYLTTVAKECTGTTRNRISRSNLGLTPIPVPPLAEQQRIVGLLDEAFEGLATAKANAEKNLQNARALFESHLQAVFTQRGEGWVETTLGDICVVDWGNTDLTKSSYVDGGKYLAVSAAGCDGRIGHKEHAKHTPVLSAIGAQCGRMFLPEEDFTAIKNTITLTPRVGTCAGKFLYRLLTHVELPKRGAAQPFIAKGDILKFQIVVPEDSEAQLRIVDSLDELEEETQRLERLYERKLAALEELKKSLLHQAFSGEL